VPGVLGDRRQCGLRLALQPLVVRGSISAAEADRYVARADRRDARDR
jgi:hypothetical protein